MGVLFSFLIREWEWRETEKRGRQREAIVTDNSRGETRSFAM
jgi:hypothetical protein